MEQTLEKTPLWLEIKTEYIDENFDKVLDYLYKGSLSENTKDSFYQTTVELLSKRVEILLDSIQAKPISEDEEPVDEAKTRFQTRLLAADLLVNPQMDELLWRHVFATMLSKMSCLVPVNYSQDLTELAIKVILGKATKKLPFAWSDILNLQPSVLAHIIVNTTKLETNTSQTVAYENKGVLEIKNGVISIAALNKDQLGKQSNLVSSISVFDEQIKVLSDKSDKVKKSESGNLERIELFTNDFIRSQRKVSVTKAAAVGQTYSEGDTLRVVITGYSENCLEVETIEPKYTVIKGRIDLSQSLLYYDASDFMANLQIGDQLQVELVNAKKDIFSIQNDFIHYIVDEVAQDDFGKEVLAKYIDDNTDRKGVQKIVWMTDQGYSCFSFANEDVKQGDFAYIKIQNHGKDKYYGYINAEFVEKVDEVFDYDKVRKECIQGFSYGPVEKKTKKSDTLNSGVVKEICRMLVGYQHTLTQPSERYKILCVARILSELVGNQSDSQYINLISDYLEDLVLFAKGEIDKMQPLIPDASISDLDSVQRKMDIVKILKAYGDDSKNEDLSDIIMESNDKLLKKVAILVQSCNRIDDVISKSMQNVIKREIIKCLSIETEGETDLEEENGIYLGIENNRQEFKSSFFHAPANAKEQNQKITIFKGVCAFLNSQAGGTLFLGVDDLGYVKGVADDIAFMEKSVYGNYHGLDGYIRYITDEAKKYFDLGVLTHVKIEPMYDNNVVAISVEPYEFKIVSVDDVAYIRLNNESVVLNETAKRQIMNRRIFSNREKAAKVSVIMEAIRDKRKVVFHNYQSSHSGESHDRNMEPFAFTTGYTHVWCYDLDKDRNAVFGTERISNVEILNEHWENEIRHKQAKMDIFHMTGDKPIHVVLQLNMMAKNLLCEEYPDAKSSLVSSGEDRWILDTDVYQIEGVGRFYIGLAGQIEILDGPELKEYVKEYVSAHLS